MINIVYSTEHWIMPKIIMGILAILLVAIIVTEGRERVKNGGSFIGKPGRFFKKDADFVKLFGTLILFAAYIECLNIIGFTLTSIIFVFLFNCLYAGTSKKALVMSVILSLIFPIAISILFGVVFNITLPSGICTLPLPSLGITIY